MPGNLMQIGLMLTATDRMSAVVARASDRASAYLGQVQQRLSAMSEQAKQFGRAAMTGGMVAAGAVAAPLYSFAQLEDASVGLESALLDSTGKAPAQFAAIEKQAISLGNVLPGTTADFLSAATALSQQGVAMNTILDGGLKAASYLSVVLKLPAAAAAEMTAKLRESYGLADHELTKMADLVQRARFAFGMTPEEIKTAASYSGSTQNTLGLTGLDNARKLLAMQGLGAGVSLEGSSWGTNFAMLLTRTAQASGKLSKNSAKMKALNAELQAYGVNLQFFDDKGSFMGLDNLVAQLEKTNALTQISQLNLFKDLFGVEAGRAAAIIAQKGVAGYEAAIAKMERQASLQQRIDLSLTTIKNTWEALTGTATNAMAAVGKPIAAVISPYITAMNDFVGGPLMTFIDEHSTLVGVVGAGTLAIGLLLVVLGGLGLAAGSAMQAISGGIGAVRAMAGASRFAIGWLAAHRMALIRLMGVERARIALSNLQDKIAYRGGAWQALRYSLMTTRYRMLGLLAATRAFPVAMGRGLVGGVRRGATALWGWTLASLAWVRVNLLTMAGLRGLAVSFAGSLIRGIRAATLAVYAFNSAMLMNPFTWIVALIAGAAFLIYKYWKPIAGFFSGLWAGLRQGLAPLAPLFERLGNVAATVFAPILPPLRALWGWLARIFTQVEDTGNAARNLGHTIGKAIGDAITWVVNLGVTIFDLPGKFFDAGVAIVQGLGDGIASLASRPVEAIKGIGSDIADTFKGLLGISSPSRVFLGYGANIGEGAALGIRGSLPQVQRAVDAMAGATLTPMRSGPVMAGPVKMPTRETGAGKPGSGGITVHFSPVIHVNGGSDTKSQVTAALDDGFRTFTANMRRYEAEVLRGRY
uniref:Phage tail tape measure protein, TP901 family, core region n=1 Tax=Candidatus Kentrum sp. LFY TaxID=2126342 RepID=A0A450WH62_9GAMM|nr:MAG: phage tail tape measure protein, TP901 family, core region [Candidatus Kentron sp. LFY]